MTATEMYKSFLLIVNQSNSRNFFTWEVDFFLNRAQEELYNQYFYPEEQKATQSDQPRTAYQDSAVNAEAMMPFIRNLIVYSQPDGFVPLPKLGTTYRGLDGQTIQADRDIQHLTALSAFIDEDCAKEAVPIQAVRDNEEFAVTWDAFEKPIWGGNMGGLLSHNPKYSYSTKGIPPVRGYLVKPSRKYLLQIKYLVYPQSIQIRNNLLDASIGTANPNYVTKPRDVNSEFPDFLHNEILRRAAALFSLSTPDMNQYGAEQQRVGQGIT